MLTSYIRSTFDIISGPTFDIRAGTTIFSLEVESNLSMLITEENYQVVGEGLGLSEIDPSMSMLATPAATEDDCNQLMLASNGIEGDWMASRCH